MTTLEERLEGPGAQPWIPDPANAKKWKDGGDERTCCELNPIFGIAVDHYTRETDYGTYDVLVLNVPGQPSYDLVPDRNDEFNLKGVAGYSVRFASDDQGTMTAYLNQPEGVYELKRKSD